MKNHIVKFIVDDFCVRTDGDLVNLNDIYALAGSPKNQDPRQWGRLPETIKLIDSIEEKLNVGKSHIYKSSRGRYSTGTWAHKLLALEYSGYLSPDLKLKINDTFLRVQSGDTSVIEEALSHQPADKQKRTVDRLQQIVIRNQHTATLQAHGVHGAGFAQCTNATYIPILGGTAAEIREQRGMVKTANLREHMTPIERAAAMLSEEISKDKIEKNNLRGNNPCAAACLDASTRVARVFQP